MSERKFLYPMRDPEYPKQVKLVPCPEEVYYAVMPEIWRGIKQMKKQGRCSCPKRKTGYCDLDCELCEFRCVGTVSSLDEAVTEDEDLAFVDTREDESASPDIFIGNLSVKMGLSKMEKEDARILTAVCIYDSEREAARKLGIPWSTFRRHLNAARERAKVDFESAL